MLLETREGVGWAKYRSLILAAKVLLEVFFVPLVKCCVCLSIDVDRGFLFVGVIIAEERRGLR